jgi:hypothetical protein
MAAESEPRVVREGQAGPAPQWVDKPDREDVVLELNRRLRWNGLGELHAYGGRGTGWGWVHIAPKHRKGEPYRDFTYREAEKLSELFGGQPENYRTNVVGHEYEDWALRLGMIRPNEYRESPWKTLQRENRD